MTIPAAGIRPHSDFPSTEWTLVHGAAGDDSDSRAALGILCGEYWYPIYAFIRRLVGNADRAQDLTQGFFLKLLDKRTVAAADRTAGRFRDFLLTCCRNFVATQGRKARTARRGGAVPHLPLDFAAADARFAAERAGDAEPERQFVRGWALAVLQRTTAQVRAAYDRAGQADLFTGLYRTLAREPGVETYAVLGALLGLSLDQVKKAAGRLRQDFKAELRLQVGQTLADPADVDDELRELFLAVGPE